MNDIKIIEYKKEEFRKIINCERLILFVGAGFVKGEHNDFGNTLLDGKELKNYFIDKIIEKDKTILEEELKESNFSEVSEYFFKIYSNDEIKKFFLETFTRVKLSKLKKDFLTKIKWKNIFTLNIDDALENAINCKTVIVPDNEYNNEILSEFSPLIVKLHGDIKKNLIYNKEIKENIIFSKLSYIKALMEKNKIYDIFLDNYKDYNTIFLGVSLDDEIELEGFIDNEFKNLSNTLNRIYVTQGNISKLKELRLHKIGINKVLIIENYNSFYQDFIELCMCDSEKENKKILDSFIFEIVIKKEKDENISYLLGRQTFDFSNKIIYNPIFNIERDVYKQFIEDFTKNNFFLIRGKRFSGKTYFLIRIYDEIKYIKKIIIPSNFKLDFEEFEKFIEFENLLIIFDSNSYDNKILNFVIDNENELISKNIKIIFTVNNGDIIESLFFQWNSIKEYDLKNKFSNQELENLNDKLNSIGVIKFKNDTTIIDYLFSVYNRFYQDKRNTSILNKNVYYIIKKFSFFSENDQRRNIIFGSAIILLIENKLYSSVFYRMFHKVDDFLFLKDFFDFFIEQKNIIFEKEQNSGFKYSLECNSCMYFFIRQIENKYLNLDNKVDLIVNIVENLYNSRHKVLAKKLINFSNLNLLFSYKKTGGARIIIYKIYDKLNKLLYNEIDYWLQRAKSILYLASKKDIKQIKNGIDYAKKAYVDAGHREKKERQALFTLALLYGRLANSLDFKDKTFNEEALEWYYKAFIENGNQNKRYIQHYLNRKIYENDLYILLQRIDNLSLKSKLKFQYNELLNIWRSNQ